MVGTAGVFSYSGDGGPAISATLSHPSGVALDNAGNIYIADAVNDVIRKVSSADGKISTVAGNGSGDYLGDGGLATAASLYNPNSVCCDNSGNLYIADTGNYVIRKVAATDGKISTIAGIRGYAGYYGDGGLAVNAGLNNPLGVAVDSLGNVYINDNQNYVIRKISALDGKISTVAGIGGMFGYSGDGFSATSAYLSAPFGIALNSSGNLFIADTYNQLIRKVIFSDPPPVITSSLTATGSVGLAFNYTISGSNIPTLYSTGLLPSGLSLTGAIISGTPTAAGSYNVTINASNSGGTGSATLVVNLGKGMPVVTALPAASGIVFGQSLASSNLSGGSANVAGVFTFSTPSAMPSVGTALQSYTFTPNDTANYNSVTGSLNVTVNKATPNVTVEPTASSITFGQSLASSNISGGSANVPGVFVFNNTSVTPPLGTSFQSVTFIPTNTANYNSVSTSVSVNVGKAPAGISISNTTQTYTGKPISVAYSLNPSTLSAAVVYYPGFNAPTDAGTYYVLVNIVDNAYYGSQSSTLTILPAAQTLSVGTPTNLRVGVPVLLTATSTSNGPISYSIVSGNAAISGSSFTARDTNPVTIQATQAGTNNFQATSITKVFTALAYSPVVIISNPVSQSVRVGTTATFTVSASGNSPTYQWNLNGIPLAGATSSTYTVTASSSNLGNYTCMITNDAGSQTSAAATLTLNTTRLVNLSARAVVGLSNLAVGFVSTGSASKSVLLRGDGPSLVNYGVTGFLASPVLTLFNNSGASLASNASWSGSSSLSSLFTQVGAFSLTATSNDAVLTQSLSSGAYSAVLAGANNSTGAAMVEIYDTDPISATSRLVNISARGMVGTGSSIMTGGFVITGNTTETVLIRAVGPSLASYGVTSVLAQPTLTVYNALGNPLASNSVWGGGSTLSSAMAQVGAFSLPTTSSDSAVIVTLPAGAYTVQVSGINGTSGTALLEIYELSSP